MNKTIEMIELLNSSIKEGGIPELKKQMSSLNDEDILALKQVCSIIDLTVDEEFMNRKLY